MLDESGEFEDFPRWVSRLALGESPHLLHATPIGLGRRAVRHPAARDGGRNDPSTQTRAQATCRNGREQPSPIGQLGGGLNPSGDRRAWLLRPSGRVVRQDQPWTSTSSRCQAIGTKTWETRCRDYPANRCQHRPIPLIGSDPCSASRLQPITGGCHA